MGTESGKGQQLTDTLNGNDAGVAVVERPARTKPLPKKTPDVLPPYRVLLHNDDKNIFEDVVAAIIRLTTLSIQEANERTKEAHDTGVSLLLITHRERAELYVEQFRALFLTVTIEPV